MSELFAKPARVQPGRWIWDEDLECLVLADRRNYHEVSEKRSDLPSPAVVGGSISPIKSMADGRVYETFRNYEKSVHRAGCEIVGFDKCWQESVKPPKPFGTDREHEADLVGDVKRALQEVESRAPARTRYRKPKRKSA
jgi:hypothetical protein